MSYSYYAELARNHEIDSRYCDPYGASDRNYEDYEDDYEDEEDDEDEFDAEEFFYGDEGHDPGHSDIAEGEYVHSDECTDNDGGSYYP